ncbi:unnamed protein product, partial [Oppiella nova]
MRSVIVLSVLVLLIVGAVYGQENFHRFCGGNEDCKHTDK